MPLQHAAICLPVLNLALLILWSTKSSSTITHTRATIPTAALSFVATLGYCVLSWMEHTRSVRPSFIIDTYLFFSVMFDAARARTLWMLGPYTAIPILFTTTIALRCVMIILESTEKRSILLAPYNEYSRETISGTFSRSVFFWLSSLFLSGYQKVLSLKDLYPLDPGLYTEKLQEAFHASWEKGS